MRTHRLLFVLLLAALSIAGCSLVPGGGDRYDLVAYFPRAVSLYEGGSVQVLGLPAGTIEDVEIEGSRVRVELSIDDDIAIPADATAVIAPQSLIGERRIQIEPAYQEGQPRLAEGDEIPNVIVPVEPDEALQQLKDFLDSLDENGLGRLIDNGAAALDGQGANLGAALDELSELVANVEANDDDIIRIAERFDDFTSTLLTREAQLSGAIQDFATVSQILADERQSLEELVTSLTSLSENGLDLVSEHAVRLRTDIEILTRLASSVQVNLDGVEQIVDGGLAIATGLENAYNEELRAIDLRTNLDSVVSTLLGDALGLLGLPTPCIDLLGTDCPPGTELPIIGDLELPLSGTDAVPADLRVQTSPVTDILNAVGTPSNSVDASAAGPAPADGAPTGDDRGPLRSLLDTLLGVG